MATITLTFDNGPEPDVTPHVLDTLRRHDLKATFFVLGRKLVEHRALAERAHGEGHWIGNHTFNHAVPLGLMTGPGAADEIARTEALIGDLAHERRFFRPYGGGGLLDRRLLNGEARDHLAAHGYTMVLWNAIPEDWRDPEGWVARAIEQCFAQEETLIVLHDLPTGAMKHLDRFIVAAKDRGVAFQQDFPASCLPMIKGRVVLPIDNYVSEAAA
ncbi:polysaccharide deacetylase family protein [Hyphomicrobium sp. CS1BSMeth3]|uniref:polysaccharide deacetylase family protein n=1 Tax=Hyphomicrobium sp. CS1BSMeth3 TaxID=1892844 RepID=UPI000931100E|nr:polysaccharide deacetylase family protein [Hyphomicrobium sp. CS1BSMeth3]